MIWGDMNDVRIWLSSVRVRSRMSTTLLLWLLAVCTSLEQALRMTRARRDRPWWHAGRFLLLAEALHMDKIERLTPLMNQFVWADEPIGRHIEHVLKVRNFVYAETECRQKSEL